jgi:hypothetical protein
MLTLNAESCYVERCVCHGIYVQCRYRECHYDECRGARHPQPRGYVLRMSPKTFPARSAVNGLIKLFVFVTDTLWPAVLKFYNRNLRLY